MTIHTTDGSRSRTVSLDKLISDKASEFASHITTVARTANNEEEIRIETEKQLAFIQAAAGITLSGQHEFTLARGRVDSLYQSVIIEYKNPKSPGARIGPRLDSPGTQKVVAQIKSRFYALRVEHGQPLNTLFGVGLDGRYFVFVRFRDDEWHVQEPVEVTKHSSERFLWALFNMGTRGKPYSPDYLAQDFGADALVAQEGVRTLYSAITSTNHPKARTFFSQWKILFGEVCGYDVDTPSKKIKTLATSYGIRQTGVKPAELLFAIHTYYALFMKLMASEIVAFFHKLPTPLEKMMKAVTGAKLRREIEDLETGSIFRHLNITNFLEGDLFSWYVASWSDEVEKLIRDMVAKLDNYNPGSLSEDPSTSRDLLKHLYQRLFPRSIRHDLGEYYTPDWLAEYTLDEVGYKGIPDHRLLDPSCGSGTFLVMAVNRIRKWYDANRERCNYDEGELCRKILSNVVGFDLNPLAVMAARTNLLIALRDLIGHVDQIELPVYLCDSIQTPSDYGDLFSTQSGTAKSLNTAAGRFLIPSEIADRPELVGTYAAQLEHCVRNGYSGDEFIARCEEENLPVTAGALHRELYELLLRLDRENRNGVWARIIKNAFAPLFSGTFDFIVGNPPWINWESLPKEYRDQTQNLWARYRLGYTASATVRLGNVKKELSALFVYVCSDHYLKDHGRLGFVITQSVFKSGANQGFRRFILPGEETEIRLGVSKVTDMSLFLPFDGAINRTAVLVLKKNSRTTYPLKYDLWVPAQPRGTIAEADLPKVMQQISVREWQAIPVEPHQPESPWLTAPADIMDTLREIVGTQSPGITERAHAGSCTWMNSVYWGDTIQVTERDALFRNWGDSGKKKVQVIEAAIEPALVYPLLRGRDLAAWRADPGGKIIVPHRMDDFGAPISLENMKLNYPKAFEYFKTFEAELKSRSGYKQLHKSRKEFYVIGNLGNYTQKEYKVAFKDLTDLFQCAVVDPSPVGSECKTVVPDHTLLFITCRTADEAYFFAGVLNSIPVRVALYCQSVGVQTQRYFTVDIARVRKLRFNESSELHKEITRLSRNAHEAARRGAGLEEAEEELAACVGGLWSIGKAQMRKITEFYSLLQSFRQSRGATEEEIVDEE